MRKLAAIGWIFAFCFSLTTLAAYGIVAGSARSAWVISPFDKDTQDLNITLDPVEKSDPDYAIKMIKCLGQPMLEETQMIVCSESELVSHEAAPDLFYFPMDTEKGKLPLQLKFVFFFAKWASIASAAGGIVALLIWLMLRKGGAPKPAA